MSLIGSTTQYAPRGAERTPHDTMHAPPADIAAMAMQQNEDGEYEIGPQPGPQYDFLETRADIAVYGGGAGGGKTFALLLDPLRHTAKHGDFSGVIFRRTYPMVMNEGGLWDESAQLYRLVGAKPKESTLEWRFPTGATVRFAHMQRDQDKYNWQGSQIPFIAFDELTHFTESQFMYVALSRGRSMSNVKPYVRATCNPDASSWVKTFLAPWVDKDSAIKAKSGEVLWMLRENGQIVWYKFDEMTAEQKRDAVSVTFISASIYDNKKLLEKNPEYLARLKALPPVDKARLLDGDWDIMPTAGKVFNSEWTPVVHEVPRPLHRFVTTSIGTRQFTSEEIDYTRPYNAVRFWDLAATEKELEGDDPDYTVGAKILRVGDMYTVIHVIRVQIAAREVENLVYETALRDGINCAIRWEIEGGASGKIVSADLMKRLAAFDANGVRPQGTKLTRFKSFAQSAHAGLITVLNGPWTKDFLAELHHFPEKGWHDDQVDAVSGAFTHASIYGNDVWFGPDMYSDQPLSAAAAAAYTDGDRARSLDILPETGMPAQPITDIEQARGEALRMRQKAQSRKNFEGWLG